MGYCMVDETTKTITNMIVCDDDETASQFGALPSYDGAQIGDEYNPPPPPPTLPERVETLEAETAELNEALNMLLTGYTGEEEANEAGTA